MDRARTPHAAATRRLALLAALLALSCSIACPGGEPAAGGASPASWDPAWDARLGFEGPAHLEPGLRAAIRADPGWRAVLAAEAGASAGAGESAGAPRLRLVVEVERGTPGGEGRRVLVAGDFERGSVLVRLRVGEAGGAVLYEDARRTMTPDRVAPVRGLTAQEVAFREAESSALAGLARSASLGLRVRSPALRAAALDDLAARLTADGVLDARDLRLEASRIAASLGGDAARFAPALEALLRASGAPAAGAALLAGLGAAGAERVAAALAEGRADADALDAVAAAEPAAAGATLRALLARRAPLWMRERAASHLVRIAPDDPATIRALQCGLRDGRKAVMDLLVPPEPAPLSPAIAVALASPDAWTQLAALRLIELDPRARPLLEAALARADPATAPGHFLHLLVRRRPPEAPLPRSERLVWLGFDWIPTVARLEVAPDPDLIDALTNAASDPDGALAAELARAWRALDDAVAAASPLSALDDATGVPRLRAVLASWRALRDAATALAARTSTRAPPDGLRDASARALWTADRIAEEMRRLERALDDLDVP